MALVQGAASRFQLVAAPAEVVDEGPFLEDVRRRIVRLVEVGTADERGGIVLTALTPTYRTEYAGEPLEFRKFGYVKLAGLLLDMEAIVLDYGGPGSPTILRLKGEAFHGAPSKGIAIRANAGPKPHEKTRLEVMRSLERTASVSGGPEGLHGKFAGAICRCGSDF